MSLAEKAEGNPEAEALAESVKAVTEKWEEAKAELEAARGELEASESRCKALEEEKEGFTRGTSRRPAGWLPGRSWRLYPAPRRCPLRRR